jgi:Tol biopolymer transport system component
MRVDLPPSRIAALQPALRSAGCRLLAVAVPILLWACGAPPSPGEALLEPAPQPTSRTISFTTDECTYCAFDISPDGRWIVFDLLGQLWRIPAEGGEAVALTDAVRDQAEDLDPSYSPDGRWIAFQGDRSGEEGLWIMPAGGGQPRMLAGTEATEKRRWLYTRPAWSPDGRRLAFTLGGEGLHLHHLDSETTLPVELPESPPGQLLDPIWLADGRLVARIQTQWPGFGGPLWLIEPVSGELEMLSTGGLEVLSPAPSPDATRLAHFAEDAAGEIQLWVRPLDGGASEQLTREEDVLPLRARWTADGTAVLYSARGRLWRVPAQGGSPSEIPFAARVDLERAEHHPPSLRFPEAGSTVPVRGHRGLALSPDGDRIAGIALGRLWIWSIGEAPAPVVDLPPTAAWLSWSPDGSRVAWSAGPEGSEQLFAVELETRRIRQLTALPGWATRPSWSPDGRRLAFLYSALDERGRREPGRIGIIPSSDQQIGDPADVVLLAPVPNIWADEIMSLGQEQPAWSPDSDAVLIVTGTGEATLLPLAGEPVSLDHLPGWTTFVHWAADSSLIYVQGNQLWRAEMNGAAVQDVVRLTDGAALYPSVARDGTILYIGADGFRLRRPGGPSEELGWPLVYQVPTPEPLLITNAKVIDGTGAEDPALSDVLVRSGRIARIARAGRIRPGRGAQIIDADGRTLMPGLIDLHVHGWTDLAYPGSLYHGITTLREMGAPIARAAARADESAAGTWPGPRVVLGGLQLSPGHGGTLSSGMYQELTDEEDGERALTVAEAFGATYIKLRVPRRWSVGAGFVEQAQNRGFRIGGHCAHPLPLIAAGIRQFEHQTGCSWRSATVPRDDLIQLYREVDLSIVPTLSANRVSIEAGRPGASVLEDLGAGSFVTALERRRYDRPASPEQLRFLERVLTDERAAVGALHGAGVRIATGTDFPFAPIPGAIHYELEELVSSGLTPMEAITAATSTAAHVLGAEEEIGTIEVGKWADLILLDADPLEDIRNTRRIWKVIQGGRVVDREGLLEWARENQQSGGQR